MYNVMAVGMSDRATHTRMERKNKRKGINIRGNIGSQAYGDLLPAVGPLLLKCLSLSLTAPPTEEQVDSMQKPVRDSSYSNHSTCLRWFAQL